jgi:hypothetical protein
MTVPPAELIRYAEAVLLDCPIKFSFDLAYIPSSKIEMVQNPGYTDNSMVGIIIYEDDIMRYSEPDRVLIGHYLVNARNSIKIRGFNCEFLPLPGKREDHNLEQGVPINPSEDHSSK